MLCYTELMMKLRLYQSTPYRCLYIPKNIAHHHTSDPNILLSKEIYNSLIQIGFRRAGDRIHRPNCRSCNQCVSLRIPVDAFIQTKSQRRIWRKNSNLKVNVVIEPNYNEYLDLYNRYINHRHPESETMQEAEDTFINFLFSRWSETFSIEYRLPSQQLVCVSICDPLAHGWSAVYTFFSIEHSHLSLGTYSILKQIQLLNDDGFDYLYLGYWIRDCDKMNYKTNFTPCEGFIEDKWTTIYD